MDTAPGLGHGRVRTQPCRRSSGLSSPHSTASALSPQHGGCHALSPLARPPLPGAVGGSEAAGAQRQGSSQQQARGGQWRGAVYPQHCTKHFHIHHPTQPQHS